MKISEMIERLQEIHQEHGDLDIYEYTDWATLQKHQNAYRPRVDKIHFKINKDHESLKDELYNEDMSVHDEDIYDIDLNRPIVKGVIL